MSLPLIMHPMGWGHNALIAVVCLSVRPSVCPVPDPKSRTEGHKLEIGRKESHDTSDLWPPLEVESQRSSSPGRLTPWPKISHIFATERPTNFKLGLWVEYDDPYHRHARWPHRSNIKANKFTNIHVKWHKLHCANKCICIFHFPSTYLDLK